eukprot:CAMPEP_0113853228 /NCGR_PEP_ID=MMETSP0372-20130328/6190_1 /TAXON_ID=340204 /ORGANISM="Lankesteria abbotti" /LENGTH=133 /DNA_ID=CAMNT_0000825347 /DNA_START=168 /DNA_END=564 /DNA_ORIENTATION=- /assembly_acc=CAM_ASM_000359
MPKTTVSKTTVSIAQAASVMSVASQRGSMKSACSIGRSSPLPELALPDRRAGGLPSMEDLREFWPPGAREFWPPDFLEDELERRRRRGRILRSAMTLTSLKASEVKDFLEEKFQLIRSHFVPNISFDIGDVAT